MMSITNEMLPAPALPAPVPRCMVEVTETIKTKKQRSLIVLLKLFWSWYELVNCHVCFCVCIFSSDGHRGKLELLRKLVF